MAKWQMSEAAERHIKARLSENIKNAFEKGDYWQAWPMLLEAVESEDFAHPRDAAEGLIMKWIRASDEPKWVRSLCADVFDEMRSERKKLREAGRDIMNGIRRFGRMKL